MTFGLIRLQSPSGLLVLTRLVCYWNKVLSWYEWSGEAPEVEERHRTSTWIYSLYYLLKTQQLSLIPVVCVYRQGSKEIW